MSKIKSDRTSRSGIEITRKPSPMSARSSSRSMGGVTFSAVLLALGAPVTGTCAQAEPTLEARQVSEDAPQSPLLRLDAVRAGLIQALQERDSSVDAASEDRLGQWSNWGNWYNT